MSNPRIRSSVDHLTGYVPGEQPRDPKIVKLNTNESPYPPSPRVADALRRFRADALRLYPDPVCTALREGIASLHGAIPDGLILCYEMGREVIYGMEQYPLASLERVREYYEISANLMRPCRVIGVSINGSRFDDDAVAAERDEVRRRLDLPVCDPIRHGPDELVEAVLNLKRALGK